MAGFLFRKHLYICLINILLVLFGKEMPYVVKCGAFLFLLHAESLYFIGLEK